MGRFIFCVCHQCYLPSHYYDHYANNDKELFDSQKTKLQIMGLVPSLNLQNKVQGKNDSDAIIQAHLEEAGSCLRWSLGSGRLSSMRFNKTSKIRPISTRVKRREMRSKSCQVLF